MYVHQSSGKIIVGEQEVELYPRDINSALGNIVYCHGAEGTNPGSMAWMLLKGRWPIMNSCVNNSSILCPELGGNATWGNNTALAAMDAAYDYIVATTGRSTISLLAQSMGATTAIAWAKDNPEKINKIALLIPVIDLQDVRNTSGYQAVIDEAYGGFYSDELFGQDHNPLVISQSSKLQGVEIRMWCGVTDTLCKIESARQFKSNLGSSVNIVELPGGHEESTVESINAQDVASFLRGD